MRKPTQMHTQTLCSLPVFVQTANKYTHSLGVDLTGLRMTTKFPEDFMYVGFSESGRGL